MKVLVIEDDLIWSNKIVHMLELHETYDISVCHSIQEAYNYFETKGFPQLMIADIIIGKQTIFDLGKMQPDLLALPTILITASESHSHYYMGQVFEKYLYLVKPFHRLSLFGAIEFLKRTAIVETTHTEAKNIVVRGIYNEKISINIADIEYLQAEGNYCIVKTHNHQYAIKQSLVHVLEKLGPGLLQCHKSFAINRRYLVQYKWREDILEMPSAEIPVGRTYKNNLRSLLQSKL